MPDGAQLVLGSSNPVRDLTFLHDTTGLVIGPDEPRPDLTFVALNDDGGGIFNLRVVEVAATRGGLRAAHAALRARIMAVLSGQ